MSRIRQSGVTIEEIGTTFRDGVSSRTNRNEYRSYGTSGGGSSSVTYGANAAGSSSATYEKSRSEYFTSDNSLNRVDRSQGIGPCGPTGLEQPYIVSDNVIETNSLEETERYLERAVDVYKDPNPQIVRQGAVDCPVQYEQRVFVRYLKPPPVESTGILTIKEVRPPAPAPPPPLVIRQYTTRPRTPPPIVLRERPPTPPLAVCNETITRMLPPLPAPPRSVIIERLPDLPEKPQDIIIERWLPYEQKVERRTVIERDDRQQTDYEARNKIIIYECKNPCIHRQFETDIVVQENPDKYRTQYGSSLLDSQTLIQLAHKYGVYEDLTPPAHLSVAHTTRRDNSNYDYAGSVRGDIAYRRQGGVYFDYAQYGLLPSGYTPGMRITRQFVRPTNFVFPASSMWSTRVAKYRETISDGQVSGVTVELVDNGVTVHSRSISESEYNRAQVSSLAPKLLWTDFIQVLKVFMMGNNQERDSDIANAFDILNQGRKGVFTRTVQLSDGLISPDELRAFLSVLTDDYRVDLCVFFADTDGSGQISLSEFTRMVRSGLARDIICERA